MNHQLTDQQLIGAYLQGDSFAFETLYNRHWGWLFNHARRMLKEADLTPEDAVQDVFVMLLSKASTLDQEKSVPAFLYSCLRNKIINSLSREKVKERYLRHLTKMDIESVYSGDILKYQVDREKMIMQRIESEIQQLPPKMRTAFELSKKHDLSYKEIAMKTGSSEGTIKKHIHIALKILRSKLLLVILLLLLFVKLQQF